MVDYPLGNLWMVIKTGRRAHPPRRYVKIERASKRAQVLYEASCRGVKLPTTLLLCGWILWYTPGVQNDKLGRTPPVKPARTIEAYESRKACEAARIQYITDQQLQNPLEAQCWPAGHRP